MEASLNEIENSWLFEEEEEDEEEEEKEEEKRKVSKTQETALNIISSWLCYCKEETQTSLSIKGMLNKYF